MKTFDCIIVDDEEVDRLTILSFVKRFSFLNISGVFDTSEKALTFLQEYTVDVAFLDIEMEKTSGIELRKKVMEIPVCVFISSYSEYAAESFELETLDFIVKPFKFDRFERTVNRIVEFMEIRQKVSLLESSIGGDVVYIKTGHEQTKVKLHEVLYLEALKNYTLLVTDKKRHCVLSNLGNLLEEKGFDFFVRVHKSFAVQKNFIQKIGTHEVELHNHIIIPIGRRYKDNLNLVV
ncbi:MAG: response regulator transcription factor [Verrucomicrobia bacterium]|nr:response regulator transcription factor [Cytophagales bacterium]